MRTWVADACARTNRPGCGPPIIPIMGLPGCPGWAVRVLMPTISIPRAMMPAASQTMRCFMAETSDRMKKPRVALGARRGVVDRTLRQSEQLADRLHAVIDERDGPALWSGQLLLQIQPQAAVDRRRHLAGSHGPRLRD